MPSTKNIQTNIDRLRQSFSNSTRSQKEGSKSENFLLAVLLNGCSRNQAGKPLTNLEQHLVKAVQAYGYQDGDLAALGDVYNSASVSSRENLFTEKFAQLNTETGYGMEQLHADLPQLAEDVIKNPNARFRTTDCIPSLSASAIGKLKDDFPEDVTSQLIKGLGNSEFIPDGVPDPGYTTTCYGVPSARMPPGGEWDEGNNDGTPTYPVPSRPQYDPYIVKLWPQQIDCHKGTEENGNDEPFFGFAVTDDVSKFTWRSAEFSMDEGDSRRFPGSDPFIWNAKIANGTGLCCVVDAWEADNSEVYDKHVIALDEIIKLLWDELFPDTWQDMAMLLIGEATGTGIPTWFTVITLGIALLLKKLLSNPDDHLGTHTVMLSRKVLDDWRYKKETVQGKSAKDGAIALYENIYGTGSYQPGNSWADAWVATNAAAISSGEIAEPRISVYMDHDDENHGIYELFLRVRFP